MSHDSLKLDVRTSYSMEGSLAWCKNTGTQNRYGCVIEPMWLWSFASSRCTVFISADT